MKITERGILYIPVVVDKPEENKDFSQRYKELINRYMKKFMFPPLEILIKRP